MLASGIRLALGATTSTFPAATAPRATRPAGPSGLPGRGRTDRQSVLFLLGQPEDGLTIRPTSRVTPGPAAAGVPAASAPTARTATGRPPGWPRCARR